MLRNTSTRELKISFTESRLQETIQLTNTLMAKMDKLENALDCALVSTVDGELKDDAEKASAACSLHISVQRVHDNIKHAEKKLDSILQRLAL